MRHRIIYGNQLTDVIWILIQNSQTSLQELTQFTFQSWSCITKITLKFIPTVCDNKPILSIIFRFKLFVTQKAFQPWNFVHVSANLYKSQLPPELVLIATFKVDVYMWMDLSQLHFETTLKQLVRCSHDFLSFNESLSN